MSGWHRFARARRGSFGGQSGIEQAAELIERGELDAALALLQPEFDGPRAVAARAQISGALLNAGRLADARIHVDPLRAVWDLEADPQAGQALAKFLARTGERDAATAIARAVLRSHPQHVDCWRVLVDACPAEQRAALAGELANAADALVSPWQRAKIVCEQAIALAGADPDASIAALARARALGLGPDETIAAMSRAVAHGADRAGLLNGVARAALTDTERSALARDVRRATVDDAGMLAVLEQHMGTIVDLCRATGARVFLLGYPFAMPKHEELVQRLATARGIPFVSMVGPFATRLATEPHSAWFVDPIHCTDRGYELMARLLAERLVSELR